MFRSRTRKILRDIWTRKGRTLLVSIAIFIGVLGVVTLGLGWGFDAPPVEERSPTR